MKFQTIQLDGREYVVMPREEFDALSAGPSKRTAKHRERGDLAEAKRRRAKGRTRAYASLRASLGLKP